jgi:DNA-binding response OmpR family regulator
MSSVPVRILAVEDDERIRTVVRMALEDEGFVVTEAEDARTALARFEEQPFDVALVDIMLPDLDGLELCRLLRRASDIPIVIVTARADSHDAVAGLEAGADDYVRKPFVVKELSARIRALLRRIQRPTIEASNEQPTVYRIGSVEVHASAGVVLRDGVEVTLTRTEFLLLCELARHRGMVLSRETLLERVWGYEYCGEGRLVDSHVRRLRAKIESDPARPSLLVTVRGLGYKLQA